MPSSTILVTGGAGFIGSHLVEALIAIGARVISLDNYSSGREENHIQGATYVRGETSDIESLIKEPVYLVYHLGEYSRVEASFNDIEQVCASNIVGTATVFEFCRKGKIKIVYAGSSTKFADGGLAQSATPYAWSKATNTELIKNYGSWFDLPYAVAYFYSVYGGREIRTGPYATVIGIFKEKITHHEPLCVVSPGTQKRNFTHIDDVVKGLLLVGEKGSGDGYELGIEASHSLLEVAELFGGEIEMLPERRGNRMDGEINTSRMKEEFGWEATIRIEDHIKEFLHSLS
jgi:UDP-glucose 4-epimerase